ncbi:RluA family pseudouridine synthase [Tepidicella baoligensis]|uniref:RluA family pseudouridine synthase n=1 Tax=Tepidicella baoligensis TaxID=2707016 RepID=UPI003CCE14CE
MEPVADEDALADEDLATEVGGAEDESGHPVEIRRFSAEVDHHGVRLDKVLTALLPEFSRSWLQQLLAQGAVRVNGRPATKPAAKVRAGEELQVELRPTAQASAFVAEPMALAVVYEDEHLLVLDKPAGLVVHPAAGHWRGTLLNGLLAHHEGAARLPRAGIVHRLDKDTSGLMVVAKTVACCDALVRMIAERRMHRVYVALAHGSWSGQTDREVRGAIGRDPRQRLRMAVLPVDAAGAKPALTRVRLLDAQPAVCWVGCKLHTGRTHQIRAHMAWLGHPLVGDTLYGGRLQWGLERQALHAHVLAFRHPMTGEALQCVSPVPSDIAAAVDSAGLRYNLEHLWQVDVDEPASLF